MAAVPRGWTGGTALSGGSTFVQARVGDLVLVKPGRSRGGVPGGFHLAGSAYVPRVSRHDVEEVPHA